MAVGSGLRSLAGLTRQGSLILMLPVLAGCASGADDIAPTYVSPVMYENFTCQQLGFEAQSISARAAQAAGVQNKQRTTDAVVTTVGLVVFWPSLFFIKGDGAKAAELANLKGQMEAVEQASIRKNCGIQFQKAEPKPEAQDKAVRSGNPDKQKP